MKFRLKDVNGTYNPIFVFGILTFLSFSIFIFPKLAIIFGGLIFLYAIYSVVKFRNSNGLAHKIAGFLVGSEVFWRMTKAGLPWEFAKLSIILILLIAILVEYNSRKKPHIFLLYILLFIPAIFIAEFDDISEYRKRVTFNLLGELLLAVSVFYFYNRAFIKDKLVELGRWIIYGIFLMSTFILLLTPSYLSIEYGRQSNFVASGGFGPNQVSVMFGLGILIIGFFIFKNITLFRYKLLDFSLLLLFSFQALFTLSRGGIFAAILALAFGIFVSFLFKPIVFMDFFKRNFLKMVLTLCLGVFSFIKADNITDGALFKRYFNKDEYGMQVRENYTAYRDKIFETDIILFFENFITGVGPGQSMIERAKYLGGEIHAAHIEFSRMLSEHGILGLIALVIMFFVPISRFFKIKDYDTKFTLVVFLTFAFLTMSHNAMRVAVPGFFYGLGFIIIYARVLNSKIKVNE